jgi:hypothetical protein
VTASGKVTLDGYVGNTWVSAYMTISALEMQIHYEHLMLKQVLPHLGPLELRQITPEVVASWQPLDCLRAAGACRSDSRLTCSAQSCRVAMITYARTDLEIRSQPV